MLYIDIFGDKQFVNCENDINYLKSYNHRLNGPALIFSEKYYWWYYKGKFINSSSQEEYIRVMKLRFLW
jgi:hypothetical protein